MMRIYIPQQASAMPGASFKGDLHRDTLVLDDVPDAVPVRGDRAEAKQAQRRVPAVARAQDARAQERPAGVGEDRRERLLAVRAAVPGAAVPRVVADGRERALVAARLLARLALALQEAVQRVQYQM